MRIAIFLQLLWVIGSIFWNLSGLDMVEMGGGVPIPAPSMNAIFILITIGTVLIVFNSLKWKVFFRLGSIGVAVFAGINFISAFSTDPVVWVNASWQWGGAVINLFGVIAGLVGVFGQSSTKGYRPDPVSPDFN